MVWWRWKAPNAPHVGVAMNGDLGDLIATEPVFDQLLEKYPGAVLHFIAHPNYFPIFQWHPGIRHLVAQKFQALIPLLHQKHPYDAFLHLHLSHFRTDECHGQGIINPRAEALGLNLSNYYEAHTLLELSSKLAGLEAMDTRPKLYLDPNLKLPIDLEKGSYWVIHRHSTDPDRNWNEAGWKRLVEGILERYSIKVVELGQQKSLNLTHPNYHDLVGKTSLQELFGILAGAQFYIGLDSGPSHAANALGIPGLILLGSYRNFKTYMPFSGDYRSQKNSQILRPAQGKAQELSFEEVQLGLDSALNRLVLKKK